MSTIPHWDLTTIYPSLSSPEFDAAVQGVQDKLDGVEALLGDVTTLGAQHSPQELAHALARVVDAFNALFEQEETIATYLMLTVSTDSRDALAKKRQSAFEQVSVRLEKVTTRLLLWLGSLGGALEAAIPLHPTPQAHAFALREMAEQARYQMSESEESLAAELYPSGSSAWGKLQGTITSQMSVPFELDGEVKMLPMPALINLRTHPDESVRRRAWEAENVAWKSVEETLAAAINGVKGTAVTLERRRGREDALHSALDAARIDRATLDAMLGAMHDSFPMFQRYFAAKARCIGKEKLAWWDLFAPLGVVDRTYSWEEATQFVLTHFNSFSPELADFTRRAIDNRWLDAEQRSGKRGGGFCAGVPATRESRILLNFDGSLDQISTLAHEMGHAWHNQCAYQQNKTRLQSMRPMTLAETASIFCETIVTQAVLASVRDPVEELGILETMLNGESQVIVDIYSRFLFEKEVSERRVDAELTAEELCEIMERAQTATYGDALDERYRQKYMWTWKPHYYFGKLAFYNFPYAFGLLFATGLYAIYEERGAEFLADYKALLAESGEGSAADLAARFGIDLRSRAFWEASLAVIGRKVDRFCALVDATA